MSWPWWTAEDGYDDQYLQARAALFAHNRRITAARLFWAPGTLETCERLDAAHPGWAVTWHEACHLKGQYRPARWAAMMPDDTAYLVSGLGWRRPWVYGATVAELEEQIAVTDGQIAAAIRERDAEWTRQRIG